MSSAFTFMQSPVGTLTLVARGECLAAVLWEEERENRVRLGALHRDDQCPVLLETARQLGEYFAGKRQCFELALDFAGTEFQRQVWAALLAIPFGETRSYSDIARAYEADDGRSVLHFLPRQAAEEVPCPRCGSHNTTLTAQFGSTACKALYRCLDCAEPFDYFKPF